MPLAGILLLTSIDDAKTYQLANKATEVNRRNRESVMRPNRFVTPSSNKGQSPKAKASDRARGRASQFDKIRGAILSSMEQGVIVWGADATCLFFNSRLHSVLEHVGHELKLGMSRGEFFANAIARGEFNIERAEAIEAMCARSESFAYDRALPSGRIVATTARSSEHGGYVVTFTDVTSARKLLAELDTAKMAAEAAENRIKEALAFEKRRQHQLRMLSLLGEWLQSCKSLDELYKIVGAHMIKLLPGSSGELYIYSNSRDVLDGACSWNEATLLDHIHADDCWSLRRGRSYAFGAGDVEFVCSHVAEQQWNPEGKGYFCIPIIAHGDTVGLLHVKVPHDHTRQCDDEFTSLTAMRMFAIQCAEQISLAVANVKLRDQLRDQSIRDALTGLYNRRYLLETMRREIGRALKLKKPLSVISFDADHFKKFNDNHGHDAGDAVLRAIGELMRKTFNADEVNCRFGGEEFVVLLPETDKETASRRADDFRSGVEALVIRYGDHNLPRVTVSLGVASLPENGTDSQSLITAADTALYRAKGQGRNCVCV